MIKISVPASSVNATQMTALNKFESELIVFIKAIMAKQENLNLRVAPSFELIEQGKRTALLSSNASFSIPRSQAILSLIKEWIEEYQELEVYIPNNTIKIGLSFRLATDEEKKADSNIVANKDLPVFELVEPMETLDMVILPQETKQRVLDDLRAITKMDLIYKKWGFEEIESIPRLVLSLYGQPGTGKTMLARAIANYFGKKLLASNYSDIESKYVGDSAKNLIHAFNVAKDNDAVLFFDEADSFLGKRIQNVEHGSEQAINSLRSQMLIALENHNGVVIFATNLVSNFDKAFESRFLDSIEIPMPTKEARAEIIEKKIPSKLPFSTQPTKEDFLRAAEVCDGIAGREIKNAILKMLLSKAADSQYKFVPEDITQAMQNKMDELTKLHSEIDKQKGKKGVLQKSEAREIPLTSEQRESMGAALKGTLDGAKKVSL